MAVVGGPGARFITAVLADAGRKPRYQRRLRGAGVVAEEAAVDLGAAVDLVLAIGGAAKVALSMAR
ncbi:MAG: hypothetical protein U0802_21135 [Candidatus Binatia bacterium]